MEIFDLVRNTMNEALVINEEITIPAGNLEISAVRSSGPGGQNVNKVSTKIELRFDVDNCLVLDSAVKMRLILLPAVKLDSEGKIIVVSQKTRSQKGNLDDALEKLKKLILFALTPPKPRKTTKVPKGTKVKRLQGKRMRGETKKLRQWNEELEE